ncbi:MAG: hypothetical protein NTZ38_00055, partial [Candidatus Taylorbacteria bacterium]|nr:hypothetical protein [Candidatus Taylorbacteria bacterium]
HGVLSISAGVDNSRIEEGIKGIIGECIRLKEEMIPDAELQKAKDYIAGTMMLGLETSDARAEFCGLQETLKKFVESPEDMIMAVNRITADDVQRLARTIFVNEGLNMAIIGRMRDAGAFGNYFKF